MQLKRHSPWCDLDILKPFLGNIKHLSLKCDFIKHIYKVGEKIIYTASSSRALYKREFKGVRQSNRNEIEPCWAESSTAERANPYPHQT